MAVTTMQRISGLTAECIACTDTTKQRGNCRNCFTRRRFQGAIDSWLASSAPNPSQIECERCGDTFTNAEYTDKGGFCPTCGEVC